MLFQDSNVPSCSPIVPNFSPNDNIEQQESRMMDIFRTYKEDYNQDLYQYENEVQSSNDGQTLKNNQLSKISANISASLQEEYSYEYKNEINTPESQTNHPISQPQNGFLSNLNNFSKRNQKNYSPIKSSPVKHLSDDESSIIKDKNMDDFIYDSKVTYSSIQTRQIEQSRSDTAFISYTFNNQQASNNSILDGCINDQSQNSPNCQHSYSNETDKCSTNLIAQPQKNNEEDSRSDSADNDDGIPLGLASDSNTSMNLSLLVLNKSTTSIEEKRVKHKSCRMSLSESRLHGKNNSGEFVGRNPSLMTIVEDEDDDAEEEFEYEEDYEEDAENINKDIKENEKNINAMIKTKSLDLLQNKANEKPISIEFNNNFSYVSKNHFQPSESQHNLSLGITCQMQTSNSTNSIPINYYVKSYAGLNSKIIDLNPTDDDNEYEYEYDEKSPISLREASDINKYSHQNSLNGSRTIEDLIQEQKKAAIASSSSAIIALAAAAKDDDDDDYDSNLHSNRRTYRKRSNISLSELVPKERACFTVEDMIRLQNIHFLSNKGKNATSNSGDVISKPNKPKYSEEEMMKDQKISIKNRQNLKVDSTKKESKTGNNEADIIETQSQSIKPEIDMDANSVSTRSINIESITSNSDESKSNKLEEKNEEILNETVPVNFIIDKNDDLQIQSEKNDEEQKNHQIVICKENDEQSEVKVFKNNTSDLYNSDLGKEKADSKPKQYSSKNNSKFILIIAILAIQFILIFFYNRKSSK